MHRSEVNMMVCSKAMMNVARKLQEAFGTPWFEGSFYGVADVSQALRDFARIIGDPDLTARTEALIAREEAAIHEQSRALARAPPGQEGPALHRRREVLVHHLGPAGPRHDRGRHRHQEVHGGGQGAHPRADGPGRGDDRGRQPPGADQDRARPRRGCADRRRPQHVHGAQGAHPLPRHQPGARLRLRGLHGDAGAGQTALSDHREPGVGGGAGGGSVGWAAPRCRRGIRRSRPLDSESESPSPRSSPGGRGGIGKSHPCDI